MRAGIWLVVMLFLATSPALGQVQFECSIDSNKLLIGDQRNLVIQINSGSSITIDSIDFSDWSTLGVEMIESPKWPQEVETTYRQQLRLGAFDTGYIKLPPLPLYFQQGGEMQVVYSNDLALEVNGIVVDSTGLAPIKPILKEPLAFRDILPYLLAFLVGCAVIALIFFRRKRAQTTPEVIVIPDPPHEIALRQLHDLADKKLWQQGQIKAYQSELTHIIRAYLEGRYDIRALESTTAEILQELKVHEVKEPLQEDLDQILNMADLIKFAKAKPSVDIHQSFMEKAEQFVHATKERKIQEEVTND